MSINVDELFGKMVTAGAQAFGAGWRAVERFATLEFKTIAQRIKDVGEGLARGDFDLPTAKLLTAMQINNAKAAIAGTTTLVTLAVAAAINAVLAVVRYAINAGLGVALL